MFYPSDYGQNGYIYRYSVHCPIYSFLNVVTVIPHCYWW